MTKGAFRLPLYISEGGGGESPDPAVYCPANGYVNPTPAYVPDPAIPVVTPVDGSVVLICSTNAGGNLAFVVNVSSGLVKYEIYGYGGTLLTSGTFMSGSAFSYTFTTSMAGCESLTGEKFFKVVFSANTAGQNITQARVNSTSALYSIVEAYINSPVITVFNFDNCQILKKVWMCETLDSLNTTSNSYKIFNNTYMLEEVTMSTSMAAATNMDYWFQYSAIKKLILPANMPSCASIKYICNYCAAYQVTLPATAKINGRLDNAFANMPNIKELVFSNGFSSLTGIINVYSTFLNSPNFEKIDFSDLTVNNGYVLFKQLKKLNSPAKDGIFNIKIDTGFVSFNSNFNQVLNAKKITYTGDGSLATSSETSGIANLPNLVEFTYPSNVPKAYSSLFSNLPALKKINLPSVYNLANGSAINTLFGGYGAENVEEITEEVIWGTNVHTFNSTYLKKLKRLNQPTLRLSALSCSGSTTVPRSLEYIEIDWANSTFTSLIDLMYNNLDATELNRIFTSLPSMTQTIRVTGNPGAATCDPSIATAKGWTVS